MACAHSVAAGRGSSAGATSDQRPAPAGGPSRDSRPTSGRRTDPLRGLRRDARTGAKVSLVTSPYHTRSHNALSSSVSDGLPVAASRSYQNEPPPASASRTRSCRPSRRVGRAHDGRREQPQPIAEVEPDAPGIIERAGTGPHHLAGRAELVEHRRPVVGDACREHVAFEDRGRDREPLELLDCRDERVDAAARCATPCQPGRKRTNASGSTGSTSRRRRASERRRTTRSTPSSHHSVASVASLPSGRNWPVTTRPAAARRPSASRTRSPSTAQRATTSATRNGPCVRA